MQPLDTMLENYTPQIETFPRRVGSAHTIIGVDLQIESHVPVEELPWVNALRVAAPAAGKKAGEGDGKKNFPARSGFDIEQNLFMPVVAGEPKNAILVGSVSTLRSAEWFIYSAEPIAERLGEAIRRQFPELEVDARAQHDPEWSVYKEFLSPSQIERLLIQNRAKARDIGELGGDDVRTLDHTLWFASSDDRNAFAELVADKGFELHYPDQDVELEAGEEDVEYGLTITREEYVDIEEMDEVVRWLYKLALRLGGEYEGWHVQH